jgi:hypothetical protein
MSRPSLDDLTSSRSARWSVLGSLVLLLVVTAPSALWAQGGGGQRQTLMELRQVNKQLNQIRQQALQDSALQARRQELTSYIKEEMRALDESTASQVDRMDSLQSDLRSSPRRIQRRFGRERFHARITELVNAALDRTETDSEPITPITSPTV